MNCLDPATMLTGVQNQLAVSLIPDSGLESIDILISSHGLMVIAPDVVLWTVNLGILGTVMLSLSRERYMSGTTGAVFCFGKNQYCTRSDTRKATTKRLMMRSLSMMIEL
jgi:hypothetical protein